MIRNIFGPWGNARGNEEEQRLAVMLRRGQNRFELGMRKGQAMGEAKRRRDAKGVTDERTNRDRDVALKEELWRIERQRNGYALKYRLSGSGIPWNAWPKKAKR